MDVVRGDKGDAGLRGDAQDAGVDDLLLAQAVVLQLEVEVVLAQDLLKAQGKGARLVHAPLQDQARNVAREAGRQRDEPFVPLREQVHVDAGLVVVALDEPGRAELDEVLIALLVFAQEHQVRVFAGDLGLVKAAALGDVDLAPDDRVDARLLAGLVEVDHAVHHAVVRDRQGLHAQLLGALHQRPDAAGAVQQGVFGVQMQVRKGHARSPPVSSKSLH